MNAPTPQGKSVRTNRLVLGLIFLVVGLALLIYNWRWILSAFHGPVEMSSHEVGRIEDPSKLPNPWISFFYASPIETGLGILEEGTKKPISRYVLACLNGHSWLVIEVPYAYKGSRFSGCLEAWTVPLRTKSLADIRSRFPQFPLLPYQMDAQYDYRGQCWALLGIIGFLTVAAVYLLIIGFASPTKSVGKGNATPAWLQGPGGDAAAPQGEETLANVFEARQINALTADQHYRVYAEEGQLYLIRIGGQQFHPMLAAHFGLLGVLIAAMFSRGNKSQDEIGKLDAQRPSDLLANHKLNFSFMISDVLEATLNPSSAMAQHGPHVGRWTLELKDGKKRTFQFEKTEDMQKAERILTGALGPMLHVNVIWDAEKERYRKR
jgi:hypothetical protein